MYPHELRACGSGSRHRSAAFVVESHLCAADLVAVIAPREQQEAVAAAVAGALERQAGTRVLTVEGTRAAWLRQYCCENDLDCAEFGSDPEVLRRYFEGCAVTHAAGARSVLLWQGVDAFLARSGELFGATLGVLCRALAREAARPRSPAAIHRAVLIGGEALCDSLEALAFSLPGEVRFRYLLVH